MTKKKWRRILGKQIRRKTGIPLPVAMLLARWIVLTGVTIYAREHRRDHDDPFRRGPSSKTAQAAAWAVQWEEKGCIRHEDCVEDNLQVVGPKGIYYL